MTSLTTKPNQELSELAEAVKLLRIAYEKYFAGVERVEPLKERTKVKKQLNRLLGDTNKNTARRFRLQSIQATLITFEQHWNRITNQIEKGTFKRDRIRAQKLISSEDTKPNGVLANSNNQNAISSTALPQTKNDIITVNSNETKQAVSIAKNNTPPPLPTKNSRSNSISMSPTNNHVPTATPRSSSNTTSINKHPLSSSPYSDQINQLHVQYIQARKNIGVLEPVSIDAFAKTLHKQESTLRERLNCREVEFKVAIKDGKVVLKATPH
ncbi:MAG: hypothetical protein JW841_10865 [Deltaproteobacteria bacterium]|nr:hypothetical protein [Deltaproteobacteria bacterium]